MPITKSNLTQADKDALILHSRKHKVYPYPYQFERVINAANFPNTASPVSLIKYFTMSFTAPEILPIISIAAGFILSPNTTVGIFGIVVSYKPTLSLADGSNTLPTDEGSVIYKLISNGGAINDFQVFYPTDWYLERLSKLYIHVFADNATVGAASTLIIGHTILGSLSTGE